MLTRIICLVVLLAVPSHAGKASCGIDINHDIMAYGSMDSPEKNGDHIKSVQMSALD